MRRDETEKLVLVLQGGGALGAYQAGAYEALSESGYEPDWVAGISIGAINAAIIAGNRKDERVDKLRSFWQEVSSGLEASSLMAGMVNRQYFNEASAGFAASFGIEGFFRPRFPPPFFQPAGSPQALSYYDTEPLRETLCDLVDFDYQRRSGPRLSVGAVNIVSGNFAYFDSRDGKLSPDHIMASGALPPGFPPALVNGEAYWDGGLVSNTPLQYVLDDGGPREDMCVFQVDLFSARGNLPQTLFDVAEREKEIRFSSRTRLNTDVFRELQTLRRAARRLYTKLPADLRRDKDAKLLNDCGCDAAVTIVHLIHRREDYETETMDYEFSRLSVEEHWEAGRDDVRKTLAHKAWKAREKPKEGVTVFDLTRAGADSALEKESGKK